MYILLNFFEMPLKTFLIEYGQKQSSFWGNSKLNDVNENLNLNQENQLVLMLSSKFSLKRQRNYKIQIKISTIYKLIYRYCLGLEAVHFTRVKCA